MGINNRKLGKGAFAVLRPGKFMQSLADKKAADEQAKNAERMRQEAFDIANKLNWEPDYVSDLVKPYQKTESPLARSFLESMLTGANPSMVSSTRLGAPRLQAGAQARFDDQFGGFDQLLQRQREIQKETPWAPGTYGHAPAVQKLGGEPHESPYSAGSGWDEVAQPMDKGEQLIRSMGVTPQSIQERDQKRQDEVLRMFGIQPGTR